MAAEYLLKWTPEQTRRLIMFRVENEEHFTKRKSNHLWGTLIRDLGLEGKMTPQQFAKKWNNLKMKYKLLKDPPTGMEHWSQESYWCWFDLMDRAMTGRMAQGEGSVLSPAPLAEGDGSVLSTVSLVKGEWPQWSSGQADGGGAVAAEGDGGMILQNSPAALLLPPLASDGTVSGAQRISVQPDDDGGGGILSRVMVKQYEPPREELGRERQQLEREQAELDRERLVLDREREQLGQEMVSVERERVVLEKEKAWVDRERGVIDRERAVLDRELTVLYREKAALDRERNRLRQEERRHPVDGPVQDAWPAVDPLQKDRLLCLWERLIDTL
ncbi:hypothetical protein N1851_032007 [Merluccius polli]|uniref:Myb/SANT-like DNA-binding domain-containing protein n=1 Tax=Merluccius polli TaxID=89951 RepID=A0AA47M3H2_MERPO|nr:hypothetical protein N1851_032007 [Merluccius polli]